MAETIQLKKIKKKAQKKKKKKVAVKPRHKMYSERGSRVNGVSIYIYIVQ